MGCLTYPPSQGRSTRAMASAVLRVRRDAREDDRASAMANFGRTIATHRKRPAVSPRPHSLPAPGR